MRILSGLMLSVGLVGPLSAQEQCAHSDLIVEIADHVIERRGELDRFSSNRFGPRMAYLKMHYADLAGEEIETLFDQLASEDGRDVELTTLRDTYSLAQDGGLATWLADIDDLPTRFRSLDPSTLRALILADQGETYLRLWAQTRPEDDQLRFSFVHSAQPAHLVSDQSDDLRLAIAEKAEQAGALDFAAALLAGLPDLTRFDEIIARHGDHFQLDSLPDQWAFARYGQGVRDRLIADSEVRNNFGGFLEREFDVDRLAKSTYPRSFLFIYHNQGGEREATYTTVAAVLEQIAAGTLDPLADPEAVWLATYRGLLDHADADDMRAILRRFDGPAERYWYDERSALEQLDLFAAKDVFGPFVRGGVADLPVAPDPTTVDWELWSQAAQVVRHGGPDPDGGRTALIELLWEAERYSDAWSVAKQTPPDRAPFHMARDLAGRLDMLCDQRSILATLQEGWGRSFFYHFP